MAAERRLSVDWPACKGHGLCAELVPELITLDEWGYPIVADRAVTRGVQSHAQRAVASCPTLALLMVEKEAKPGPTPGAADPISGAIQAVTGPQPTQRRPAVPPRRASQTPPAPTPVLDPIPAYSTAQRENPAARETSTRRESPAQRGNAAQPTRRSRRAAGPPADDPITGAIQTVTGPNAVQRRTPPTGMARHATPAYGQPSLVPEAEPYEPGDSFFDGYEPRQPYESKQPRTRREARARRK